MSTSILISISESDIIKTILEFLESRHFHIAQFNLNNKVFKEKKFKLSLERETGIINGKFSDNVLFLRQLILDGQWDSALDFVEPLKETPTFNMQVFRYYIMKYKYYELLCIKQEPGFMHDNDFAVEEIVECLKELENLCTCLEEFRRLCSLLTLKKLSDYEDLKNWNPSSARIECFYKILPLVSDFFDEPSKILKENDKNSLNDRLIQLITKGILYESAVDYCQNHALQGKNDNDYNFTKVLNLKPKISSTDLSLISWLEVLDDNQFTIPFHQKILDFNFEILKKPKLEAQWTEQILATPIKPKGNFPHALVPNFKFKCAQKVTQSMIVPLSMSISSFNPHLLNNKQTSNLHPLSQSTTADLNSFSINVKQLENEATMRQSQLITSMLENVSIAENYLDKTKSMPSNIKSTFVGNVANNLPTKCNTITENNNETINCKELDATYFQNQSIPPNLLCNPALSPVPELPTFQENLSLLSDENNPLINSKFFHQFALKANNNSTIYPSTMHLQQHQQPIHVDFNDTNNHLQYFGCPSEIIGKNQKSMFQQTLNLAAMHPQFFSTLPSQNLNQTFQPNFLPQQLSNYNRPMSLVVNTKQQMQNLNSLPSKLRPKSFVDNITLNENNNFNLCNNTSNLQLLPPVKVYNSNHSEKKNSLTHIENNKVIDENSQVSAEKNTAIQFVPILQYQDIQAIRTVAFHPSGKFFAIGTNSKQLLICKYPDIKKINITNNQKKSPEILLSRPKQHRGSVYCCGFNTSGELIATGSNDKTIRLMAFNANECKIGAEMELTIHDGTVRDLIFMEDMSSVSSILISGGAGNCNLFLTDCNAGKTFKSFDGHTAPILGLYSWAPCKSFASCSQDKTIRFWDLRASSAVNVIYSNPQSLNSPVTSVCIDPSGKLLVSGYEDASIMLYDIIGGRIVQIFRPHADEVRTVRCSNAAYYLLSGSYDKRIIITDIRGDLTAPLVYLPVAEHDDKIIQCRWHPQDFTFLSTSADKTVVLWSLPQIDM